MLIFRLETEDQEGVYSAAVNLAFDHARDARDPPPQDDTMRSINPDEYCGFKDVRQMRQWFRNKHLDSSLEAEGIQVSTYEIDPSYVRVGRFQVVFQLDYAVRVDRQPLENYHA